MIDLIRNKILLELIFKHFMRLPTLVVQFFRTNHRIKLQFLIHILMNGCGTVMNPSTSKINRHRPITVNTMMFVVNCFDLGENFHFLSTISSLPVFPVVVISIRANGKPAQQPTNPKFSMILLDESISL